MKEWLIRLTLLAFGSIIGLIILEFGLTKFAPHPKTWPKGFHERNKYLGYKGVPNKEGEWVKGRVVSYVKMNSHGFRDKERRYDKGKGVFRIVVLGDSMTAGIEVFLEQTYPYILEEKLNSHSNKKFEVINLGVPGFSTAQEYLTLKYYGLKYAPDLVLLALYIGNDIEGNSIILHNESNKDNVRRPYFVLQNGKLKELPFKVGSRDASEAKGGAAREETNGLVLSTKDVVRDFVPNVYYSFGDRIRGVHWVENFLWKIGVKASKPRDSRKAEESNIDPSYFIYSEQYSPEWQNAWEITKALILRISKLLKENRIEFMVVVIPNEDEYTPRIKKHRQIGADRFDLRKPERILSKFFESNNIDYLLLRPEFEKYVKETGKQLNFRYSYEHHLNATGYALAAQVIYQSLKNDLLLDIRIRD